MKQINNWETAEGSLGVTLHTSSLIKKGYYGKVHRNTVQLNKLIGMIAKKHPGISESVLQMAANLLQEEMLELLGMGFAVSMLELCVVYPSIKGTVAEKNVSAVKEIIPRFSASDILKKCVSKVGVDSVIIAETEPLPETIFDTSDKDGDGKRITVDRMVRVKGNRLKLGGEDSGVYLAPVLDDLSVDTEEGNWLSVPDDSIVKSTMRTLEFYVPNNADVKKQYCIAVKTMSPSGTYVRNQALIGFSEPVSVRKIA